MPNENKEILIHDARLRSQKAQVELDRIENLLLDALSTNYPTEWESLRKTAEFFEEPPLKPMRREAYPVEPKPAPPVRGGFWNEIEYALAGQSSYQYLLNKWEERDQLIAKFNNEVIPKEFEENLKQWKTALTDWETRKQRFEAERDAFNTTLDRIKNPYFAHEASAVVEYCGLTLNCSIYPETFERGFEFEYQSENKILIVEFQLPSIESFPTLKEVRYIATRDEFKESRLSEVQLSKTFDNAIYKITLRTIHELFNADIGNALGAISLNGWVKAVNKANGRQETNCILTIQVTKDEFANIELDRVDPKTCFKSLKGVSSSKLSSLTSVPPILQINKVDRRFVDSYQVASGMDGSTNIAAMDWEDFEHLIRELFEKEFSSNGGEVKVTRASRDGGVDAVAFDPDPLRGGKIVIQAKRYTNTVGVSAVRDLYGTVVNEGATKGILVTTADYGPDAYEFARGKPITLLSGANLLHLLEKHGHHAKIDIKGARALFAVKDHRNI